MVQLQLLNLTVQTDVVAVPMDVKVRVEVIDLMARILVAVFQGDQLVINTNYVKHQHSNNHNRYYGTDHVRFLKRLMSTGK